MKNLRIKALAVSMIATVFGFFADDIIVLKNGDLIKAKVLKITPTEVEYKKASRLEGPTYTVAKSNILSINYEDGEKEVFNTTDEASVGYSHDEAKSREANDLAVRTYNSKLKLSYNKDDVNKKADTSLVVLGLTSNTQVADDCVEIKFKSGDMDFDRSGSKITKWKSFSQLAGGNFIEFSIENKTDNMIYVDLGKSLVTRYGITNSYYIPKAVSNSNTTSTGLGVNLGAVSPILNGVTVGGGQSSNTTTTTFSERVLVIPPHSSRSLIAQNVFGEYLNVTTFSELEAVYSKFLENCSDKGWNRKRYYGNLPILNFGKENPLKRGEILEYSEDDKQFRLKNIISYSFSEDGSNPTTITTEFYIKSIIGWSRGMKSTPYSLSELHKTIPGIDDIITLNIFVDSNSESPIFERP